MGILNPLTVALWISVAATTRPSLTRTSFRKSLDVFYVFPAPVPPWSPCHHRVTTYHTTVCPATRLWCHATHLWCIVAHLCILLHILTESTFTHLVNVLPTMTPSCGHTHRQLRYVIVGGFWKHFFPDRVLFSMGTSFWYRLLLFWLPPELLFR